MNSQNIGEKLAALRGSRSQSVVAKDIGVSVSALGMYEVGQRIPRDEVKVKLARYYGKTVGELFFEEECHIT